MTQTKVSIVVPVYGCRDCLKELAARTKDAFADLETAWELVLVDDRGPDQPWEVIKGLADADDRVRGVRLTRNHGQHLAIWAGLEAATGDYVAVIDCDLQDDPAQIPRLLTKIQEDGVEAVVVNRGSWSDSRLRRFASRSFYRVLRSLTGISMQNVGNFGIYSRRMVDILLMFREQEVFLPIMVSLTGLPSSQFEIDRDDRAAGSSGYSFGRLISMAIATIVRFTDRPLKLSVVVGLLFSAVSALISVVLLLMWAVGSFTVPGWTSTILSLWFLSGLIMAVLGIHGFYLGRVFREVQGRPRILIEQVTGRDEPTS